MTARLMLEHKNIDYKRVHLLIGPHAFAACSDAASSR